MNKVKAFRSVLIFSGLMFCSCPVFTQQIAPFSTLIITDTLSSFRSNYCRFEEGIPEENMAMSDGIIQRQGLTISSMDYSFSSAQLPPKTDTILNESKWILTSMLEDQGKLWTSPLRIKKKDLMVWIPVLTATAVTILYDEEIYSGFKEFQNNHEWVSDISPVITWGGENVFVLSVGGLFYLSGVLSGKEKARQTGLIALQTWIHTGIIVQVGKLLSGRQRPSYSEGKDKWYGFPASLNRFKGEPTSKYDAFPSGHTIEAWALATIIAEQYKDIKIIPVISYTLATGVGLSRVTEDAHWLSDVILGGALGYSIGRFMIRERKDTHWIILPKTTGNDMIITAVYRF
jgi:hypothetical protein